MDEFQAPERPTPAQGASLPGLVSRGLRISAVCFGVVVGAYVAQKAQTPLGLDGNGDTLLFWVFSLAVMAVLALAFVIVVVLTRASRRP